MKKVFSNILLSTSLLLLGSFKAEKKTILTVEVNNFKSDGSSKIYVSVFYEKGFLEKSIQTKSIAATGNKAVVSFELPPGDYAVSTYHDINKNNKLDRYFFGKPKEPYGFSNNIKPFGPPSYQDCKITIGQSAKTIKISLLN
jgi:uncharacterized protein (DUF2141 family)